MLAGDPRVTPTWVLAGKPENELADLDRQCGSAGSSSPAAEGSPAAADKGAVPAKDSLESDDQLWPGATPEATEEGRQHESITRFQIGPRDLSLKNANLVAKHEQLNFAIVPRSWTRCDEDCLKEEPKAGVDEGGEQGRGRS